MSSWLTSADPAGMSAQGPRMYMHGKKKKCMTSKYINTDQRGRRTESVALLQNEESILVENPKVINQHTNIKLRKPGVK